METHCVVVQIDIGKYMLSNANTGTGAGAKKGEENTKNGGKKDEGEKKGGKKKQELQERSAEDNGEIVR